MISRRAGLIGRARIEALTLVLLLVAWGSAGCSVVHFGEARFERQRELLGAAWDQILWPDECRPFTGPPCAQSWPAQVQDHLRRDDRAHEWWWCGWGDW
jgi:hypothetical protein